jgi:hypothetical protein
MTTVYNLFTNPSFISNTTGWSGYEISETGTPTLGTDGTDPLFGTGYSAKITLFKNLISNSNFETDISDWVSPFGLTLSRNTSNFYSNAASLRLVNATGAQYATATNRPNGARLAVTAGQTYTFSYYIKKGTSTSNWFASIKGFDALSGGSAIDITDGTSLPLDTNGLWTRRSVTATIPSSGVNFIEGWVVNQSVDDAGAIVYVDAVMLELSATLNSYHTAGGNGGIITNDSYRVPVVAGNAYTFSAYVKVPLGQETSDFKLRAYFYTSGTAGSGDLSSSDSAFRTISSYDGWVRLTFTFAVPATATHFRGFVFRSASENHPAGYNFLVDALQFETGSEATPVKYDQGQKNRLVDTALSPKYIDHLTGMKLKADIRLGDFVFNRIDEYGVVWVVNDIQGWWSLPDIEMQDLPRGWGDGSYTTYGRYSARQLTITGSFILQDTDTQLEAARGRLIDAINLVKKDAWLILNEDTPKALKVRVSGTPEISTTNPRGRTDFSIGLVSADPIKYKWADARDDGYALATANSNAEVVTIRNEGNTPVSAIFEIIGPTTGPVSIFNRTSEQLLDVIYKLDKYKSFTVSGSQVSDGNLVFTTSATHGFTVGDAVDVLNVIDTFDIASVVCSVADHVDIVTSIKHGFAVGQEIQLTGVSSLFGYGNVTNGIYYITNVYSSSGDYYRFRATKAGLSLSVTESRTASVAKFSVFASLSTISYNSDTNVGLVNTANSHGFIVGDQIVLSNASDAYNGTYVVVGTPSTTSFEVNIFGSQKIVEIDNYESSLSLGTITFASGALDAQANDSVTISGVSEDFNGIYKVVSANSTAITFNKTFPSVTASSATDYGTIQISSLSTRSSVAYADGRAYYGNIYNGFYNVDYVPTDTSKVFKVIRPTFYGNVANASQQTYYGSVDPHPAVARVYGETLSIDSYTREIALNGELGGYRSKLDTIVDWIELQPGDNEIIFEDLNNKSVAYVQYTHTNPTTTATIITKSNHNFVVGSQIKLIGLNTVAGGSNVFANASTAEILTVPDTKSFTFTPTNSSGAANISSTAITSGYIYEISPAYLNIYYRSGWIG